MRARLPPGSIRLTCVPSQDNDEVDGSVLSIGGAFGEILKSKTENEKVYMDDLTSQRLDPTLVKVVRGKEMDYVRPK